MRELSLSRYDVLTIVVVAVVTGAAGLILQATGGIVLSVAVVAGTIPYTYSTVRRSSIFDYPEFHRDEGPLRVAGWILVATVVTGVPAIVLGALLTRYLLLPFTEIVPLSLVSILVGLVLPLLFAWRLVVVRWNPEYRTDQESQPSGETA